ncbi:MAG: 2-amino-4-hydroxy-6-hydroxymethyldihydropteridine diphosphokinase [Candidatus Omnitrophica bacterium]|nr:2-amino-4-hydroxy-6-hydroxymethyldihydropteridine diphosphokinase [Candidatus Omnitrophota bacterium]
MVDAYIGIGSNLGNRRQLIQDAVKRLGRLPQTTVIKTSQVKEYLPVGGPPQNNYFNTVAAISTSLTPQELMKQLQSIEKQLGRIRPDAVRWGPRTIDLDLLLYGGQVIDETDLQVPHPRMHERKFVLEPLSEIAPDVIHPTLKRPINSLASQCS